MTNYLYCQESLLFYAAWARNVSIFLCASWNYYNYGLKQHTCIFLLLFCDCWKVQLLMSYMHFNNRKLSIIIHLFTTPLHVYSVCGISEEFHDPWQHINCFIAVFPKNKMPKIPSSPLPSPKRGIPSSFLFFPLPSFFLYDWATHNIHYGRVAQAPKHPFCIFLYTLS